MTNVPSAASTPAGSIATTGPIATSAPTQPVSIGFPIFPALPPADFRSFVTCTGAIGPTDPVAVVQLHGTPTTPGPIVLRDYADLAKPRTVCTFTMDGGLGLRLVDAHHAVMDSPADEPGAYVLVDLPEVRYHWFTLPGEPGSYRPELAAVSPTLDRVAWLSLDPEGAEADAVHVTTAAGDHVVAQLPDQNTGRCGDPDDSNFGAYTQSGSLLYVLNRPLAENASLLVVDGEKVAYSMIAPKAGWPAEQGPAMAVWSPTSESLYYRSSGNGWMWTAKAGPKQILPGVRWSFPTITPDGSELAYAAPSADGLSDVYLVGTATNASPKRLGTGRRNFPAFLNDKQLWYIATDGDAGCAGGGSEKPLVYSIGDGTEASSVIDAVISTWPATSSNG